MGGLNRLGLQNTVGEAVATLSPGLCPRDRGGGRGSVTVAEACGFHGREEAMLARCQLPWQQQRWLWMVGESYKTFATSYLLYPEQSPQVYWDRVTEEPTCTDLTPPSEHFWQLLFHLTQLLHVN